MNDALKLKNYPKSKIKPAKVQEKCLIITHFTIKGWLIKINVILTSNIHGLFFDQTFKSFNPRLLRRTLQPPNFIE